jgi:hypothetical protein
MTEACECSVDRQHCHERQRVGNEEDVPRLFDRNHGIESIAHEQPTAEEDGVGAREP